MSTTHNDPTPSCDQQKRNIAFQKHNHAICIENAMDIADQRCKDQGVRLTQLRRRVLELIWQSHKPLGAYDLLDMLSGASQKRIAPPTIYRALDFLQQQRLVHRIASLNAFIGCCASDPHLNSAFLICQQCEVAIELEQTAIQLAIEATGKHSGFSVISTAVEVVGLCPGCLEGQQQ